MINAPLLALIESGDLPKLAEKSFDIQSVIDSDSSLSGLQNPFLKQLESLLQLNELGEFTSTEGEILPFMLPGGKELPPELARFFHVLAKNSEENHIIPGQIRSTYSEKIKNAAQDLVNLVKLQKQDQLNDKMEILDKIDLEKMSDKLEKQVNIDKPLLNRESMLTMNKEANTAIAMRGDFKEVNLHKLNTQWESNSNLLSDNILKNPTPKQESTPQPGVQGFRPELQILEPGNIQKGNQTFTVSTSLNKPDWGESFNSQLVMMAKENHHSAQIRLNPPELGPIEVRIVVNNDQTSINFISQHTLVRDAIEEAFPRLRELMAQAGVNLGDVNVSQQSSQQQQMTSENQGDESEYITSGTEQNNMEEGRGEDLLMVSTHNGLIDHYI